MEEKARVAPEVEGYIRRRYEDLAVCIHYDIVRDRGLYNYFSPWLDYMMDKHDLPDHVKKKSSLVVTDSTGRHIGCSGASQNTLEYYNPLGYHIEHIYKSAPLHKKNKKTKAMFVSDQKSSPNELSLLCQQKGRLEKVEGSASGHESVVESNCSLEHSKHKLDVSRDESNSQENEDVIKRGHYSNADPLSIRTSVPDKCTIVDMQHGVIDTCRSGAVLRTVPVTRLSDSTGVMQHRAEPESKAVEKGALDHPGSCIENENVQQNFDDKNECRDMHNNTEIGGVGVNDNVGKIVGNAYDNRQKEGQDSNNKKDPNQTNESHHRRSRICNIL